MNKKTATDKKIIIFTALVIAAFAFLTVITVIWVIPGKSPVLVTAPAAESTVLPLPGDLSYNDVVYVIPGGRIYHFSNDCTSGEGTEIFMFEAIERDLEPCPKCFKNITPAH